MSRQTVRESVAAFFAPPAVQGLNKVFTARPKRGEGTWYRYGQPAGTPSGAFAVVFIESEYEQRIAIGGEHSGKKRVFYTVRLDVYCHSVERHSEDAMAFFDTVIDGIKDRLRSDRRLNNYPIIFEAGENELSGEYGDPVVSGTDGSTMMWGRVRFNVNEVLTT